MPTLPEFLEDVATTVAATATSRDAALSFLRHQGSVEFKDSPVSGRDGFAVGVRSFSTSLAFGTTGHAQREVMLALELGHAPFNTDDTRRTTLARDVERLMDLLEAKANWSAGSGGSVGLVNLEPGWTTDDGDPSWWRTLLVFRCLVIGPIATS